MGVVWTLVPKTIPLMVFEARVLKSWVLGPSGLSRGWVPLASRSQVVLRVHKLLGPSGYVCQPKGRCRFRIRPGV